MNLVRICYKNILSGFELFHEKSTIFMILSHFSLIFSGFYRGNFLMKGTPSGWNFRGIGLEFGRNIWSRGIWSEFELNLVESGANIGSI